MSTIGRRTAHRKRLPPRPEQPPEGYVTVPDCLRVHWPTGFAPAEALQQQAMQSMWNTWSTSFRALDNGNDYDLAARTKAARERKRGV